MKKSNILILLCIILFSCTQERTKYSSDSSFLKGSNTDRNSGEVINDLTNFEVFWRVFRSAVLRNDRDKIIALTVFPFTDYYNDIYDPQNSLTSSNDEMFKEKFFSIFDSAVRDAIQANSFRGYNRDFSDSGDVISKDNFLLVTKSQGRPKDLIFIKNDKGEYRLSGIAYYQ